MAWLVRVLVGLACIGLLAWMALAVYFSPLEPPWLRVGLTAIVPVGAIIALILVRAILGADSRRGPADVGEPQDMSPRGGRIHQRRLLLLAALCLALGACTSPVRAVRVDRTVAHRDLARSVITTGEASWPTRDVLLERGLLDTFGERPEIALSELHRAMIAGKGDPDLLFALAELSFLHGETAAKPEHRGRGYASGCVAALSQAMLDRGKRFCALYTDLSNPISNKIYQNVGYRPIVDCSMVSFGESKE